MAQQQAELKADRKTGPLGKLPVDCWGYLDYRKMSDDVKKRLQTSYSAANKVERNRTRITAALNLYHELRGSDYRHNVRSEDLWCYDRDLKKLREQFPVEETVE